MSMEDALKCVDQVIQQFNKETEIFQDYLSSSMFLRNRVIDVNTFCDKIHTLFRGHPELIKGLHSFFPEDHNCVFADSRSLPPPSSPPQPTLILPPSFELLSKSNGDCRVKSVSKNIEKKIILQRSDSDAEKEKKKCVDFVNRVSKRLEDDEKCKEFLDKLLDYKNHKNIDILDKEFLVMFKDMPEMHIEFTRFAVSRSEEESMLIRKALNSYKSDDDDDDNNNNKKRKIPVNPYEENLFGCEEDMYKADMMFERLKSTKEAVERYLIHKKGIESGKAADGEEEFLGVLHKIQIKKLYANSQFYEDLGEKMLDQLLNKKPIIAGERILRRLTDKLEECKIWHDRKIKICEEGFECNYAKAMNYKPPPQKRRKRGMKNNI